MIEMIKIGDYVVLKKKFEGQNRDYSFPMEVKKIKKCGVSMRNNDGYAGCRECPGYINDGICFGRGNIYLVEAKNIDWDD